MWPFGVSAKDRERIRSLEYQVESLREDLKAIIGSPSRFTASWRPSRIPMTLHQACDKMESLADADAEIMAAAGLVRMVQPAKTWIQKKGAK